MTQSTADERPSDRHLRRRRYDPDRRERIIEAAFRVIARDGLGGMTHRSVAREADIPVGSTTYHFADKDDLLLSVLEYSGNRALTSFPELFASCHPEKDLAGALAELVLKLITRDREQLMFDYAVFLGARSRPPVHEAALKWANSADTMIEKYTDPLTAHVLAELLEGMLAQHVVFGRKIVSVDEVRSSFTRVLHGRRQHAATTTRPEAQLQGDLTQ
ncbi:MAG TPA: TetR family transcriptional regulator [Pseudolysinimonas sp.]|nr:TetR family transcriptional regulator [Pseudolysinimonas sp.]